MFLKLLNQLRKNLGSNYEVEGESAWVIWKPFTLNRLVQIRHVKSHGWLKIAYKCSIFRDRAFWETQNLCASTLGLIDQGLPPEAINTIIHEAKKLVLVRDAQKVGYKDIEDFVVKISDPEFEPTNDDAKLVKNMIKMDEEGSNATLDR